MAGKPRTVRTFLEENDGKGSSCVRVLSVLLFKKLLSVGFQNMGVSQNRGTPKSSHLIGFSIINHPFWDTPIFGNTHIDSLFTFSKGGKTK